MGFLQEFKEFAMKGNVVDLAVGVVIGGAFGKIVTSLVSDIIMPPIGLITGGMNFKDLKLLLPASLMAANGKPMEPVSINYGNFIQQTVDFIIIALSIFLVIQAMNKLRKPVVEAPAPAAPPSREEILLTEIRDLLKGKN